jgi:hypothetical protein
MPVSALDIEPQTVEMQYRPPRPGQQPWKASLGDVSSGWRSTTEHALVELCEDLWIRLQLAQAQVAQ